MSCISCKNSISSSQNILCSICWSEIEFLNGKGPNYAVAKYNGVIRKLIHIFKYKSPWSLCNLFINWMSLTFNELIEDTDIILPVPIHKYKLMKRGYNQTAIIAKELAKKYNKKCFLDLLVKVKNVQAQSTLNREERMTNIIGSFGVNKRKIHYLANRKILIIDDVITTGSTLLECIKVLNGHGATAIETLSIAMTDYD